MRKGELDGRIDPNFYLPLFKVSDRSLFKTLNEVSKYILHPPEYPRVFSESGFQLLRSQNVRPLGINLDENPVFFSDEFLKDKKVVFARKGDVLIVRSGVNAGDVSAVEEDYDTAIIGADTLLCRCNSDIFPKFLQVYFHTDFGKRQILRHTTGATNKHLNSENLKKVLIPNVSLEIQNTAIALFEESLEAKRAKEAEAKSLLDGIDAYLLERLGIETPAATETKRTFFVQYSTVSGNRFDASAYRQSFNYDSSKFQIEKLSKIAFINPKITFEKLDAESEISFVPMEVINEHDGAIEEWRTKKVRETKGFTRFRENDLIWAKITPCMQNGKSVVARNLKQGFGCGSTEFYVIRPRTKAVSVDYLHFLLRNKRVLENAQNFFGGSAGQQRVSVDFLKNFQVPVPPLEIQEEIAAHIQAIRERAKELEREAQAEIERAKAEVEQMILGEVSTDA